MNLRKFRGALPLIMTVASALAFASCIYNDENLGESLVPDNQKYDIYTAEFPLENVKMEMADSLSGYSDSRISIGAIRDGDYGLTTRATAFSLVPVNDTLDFGKNAKFRRFHFSALADSVSVKDENQRYILQNIYVYELQKALDLDNYNINGAASHNGELITKGVPVYNGSSDSLSFDFSKAFGEKYMKILNADLDSINHFTEKFPGIYICTNDPVGEGGRLNFFELGIGYNSSYYYITSNYAELSFTADYGTRTAVDTSFLFYFGPTSRTNISTYISSSSTIPQYGYNMAGHETRSKVGDATDKIFVEGGGGLKPVFSAKEIREKLRGEIAKHGNPDKAIINKATIKMTFEFPSDYTTMYEFPQVLSPTCRIKQSSGALAFASITDSSDSNEDEGDINRSLCDYAPDVSFHVQELIELPDTTSDYSDYDVWMLILATVEDDDSSSSSSDYSSSYYNSYYNSLYNSSYYNGYGSGYGYSDYYGYNNYYNNYYNYYDYSSYYSSSSSTTSSVELDKYRYYNCALNGPKADSEKAPKLVVTYALPKSDK